MCRGRGLFFDRINPTDDLLLPPSGGPDDLDAYKALLDHYAVRLVLKEIIKSKGPETWRRGRRSLERFCQPEALDAYLGNLQDMGVVKGVRSQNPIPVLPVRSFGATYEWYVAQVLISEFSCPSAWGVRFADMQSGGDHDVIASIAGRFLYLEVKTAPPKHIEQPEVTGFIRRLYDIAPDIAVFHNDTHLRMKDKLVPLLEETIMKVRGIHDGKIRFSRLEREIFHLDSCIYVLNSKPDLRRNLTAVFRHHFRTGNPVLKGVLGVGRVENS
jgi:hypothetical protein